jgi:transposase
MEGPAVRVTSLLKKLLGMKSIIVDGVTIDSGGLVIDVRPSWWRPRCSGCGKQRSGYDQRRARRWRHLGFGGAVVWLRYAPRRVACPSCGVVVEQVPWSAAASSRFTEAFENAVAYLTQRCDKSSVQETMRIGWQTVGAIVERVVERTHDGDPLDGLRRLGIDELSYRKGHRYLTVVVDQDTGMPVWAADGKSADTLEAFFDELGPERCQRIEAVSIDMSQAYISAVEERLPHAQIVFDRFHVQALVNKALDETRREEWRRLRVDDAQEAKGVKGLRWPLLKNPWNLTDKQKARLSTLQRDNARLYRAYLLKETFADILSRRQPNVVEAKLRDWLAWASRCRLPAFVGVARTIRKHFDDIVAYIRLRLTNGLVEGINNKARMLTRRAYGFHSAGAVIAMIMLCCTNIWLAPPYLSLAK